MQSNKTKYSSLFFCLFNYTTREKDTTMQSSSFPCNSEIGRIMRYR